MCGQAVKASIAHLEACHAFGQGDDDKALTYDRVVHALKIAAESLEAARATDHECTVHTCSAPPIHSSLDTVQRFTTVRIAHLVCRANECTCIAVPCRVASERCRLRRRIASCRYLQLICGEFVHSCVEQKFGCVHDRLCHTHG